VKQAESTQKVPNGEPKGKGTPHAVLNKLVGVILKGGGPPSGGSNDDLVTKRGVKKVSGEGARKLESRTACSIKMGLKSVVRPNVGKKGKRKRGGMTVRVFRKWDRSRRWEKGGSRGVEKKRGGANLAGGRRGACPEQGGPAPNKKREFPRKAPR